MGTPDDPIKAECPKCKMNVAWLVLSLSSFVGDLMRTGVCDCVKTLHVWDEREPKVVCRVRYAMFHPIRENYEVTSG